MPNNIAVKQNDPGFLRMLHAQMQLYSEAKRIMQIRLYLSLTVLLFPILNFVLQGTLNDYEYVFAILAIIASFLPAYILKASETKKINSAAAIQEQHDAELYDIEWNEAVAAKKVLTEEIIAADKRYKGLRHTDWYEGIPDSLSMEQAALFCQKQNLSWDTAMREDYTRRFIYLGLVVLLLPIFIACVADFKLLEYLVKILAPSLPLLILCYDNYRAHKSRAEQQEAKALDIEMILQSGQKISKKLVRKNQDQIFRFRKESMLIPDRFAKEWANKNR